MYYEIIPMNKAYVYTIAYEYFREVYYEKN